jgi:hypothetical protein
MSNDNIASKNKMKFSFEDFSNSFKSLDLCICFCVSNTFILFSAH